MNKTTIIIALGWVFVLFAAAYLVPIYAAYQANLDADVNITGYGVAFYTTTDGTTLLTKVHFNDLARGGQRTANVCLKNVGNTASAFTVDSPDMPAGVYLSWNGDNQILSINQIKQFTVALNASDSAPMGLVDFTLVFSPT